MSVISGMDLRLENPAPSNTIYKGCHPWISRDAWFGALTGNGRGLVVDDDAPVSWGWLWKSTRTSQQGACYIQEESCDRRSRKLIRRVRADTPLAWHDRLAPRTETGSAPQPRKPV